MCDLVGIIRDGRLIKTERVETLMRQQFKRLHLTLREQPSAETFAIAGVREQRREGATVILEIRQNLEQVMAAAAPLGIVDVETLPVTLEEVFLAYYSHESSEGKDA